MEGKQICRVAEEELWLLPERAVYWPATKTLLLADVHLGKAAHFRKAGMAVPATVAAADIVCLGELIANSGAERVIFLGDLFHSKVNREWFLLEELMNGCQACEFVLIKGNHDILPAAVYAGSRLQIYEDEMIILPFLLTHEPPEAGYQNSLLYTLCGHIHPGVTLTGPGGQRQKLACFYFGLHYGLLPAFGKFTGLYNIKPKPADAVFGVLPHKVLTLQIPQGGGVVSSM